MSTSRFAGSFIVALISAASVAQAQQVIYQSPPPVIMQQPVVVQQAYCRPYSDTLKIGGELRVSRGVACLQPDGAWQLQPNDVGVNYITRGGQVFVTSPQPFAALVIDDHHRHRDHRY